MAEGSASHDPSAPALLAWALASFHTALLVALVLGALYGAGVLGRALAGLDTAPGAAAYLYLWGVVWWTNRTMLDGLEGDLGILEPRLSELAAEALKWGGLAGVLVALPLFVLVGGVVLAAGGVDSLPFLALGLGSGLLLAAGIGAVVGASLALLDLALLVGADRWLRGGAPGSDDRDLAGPE